MRPTPAIRTGRISPVLLLLAVVALACDPPTGASRVRSVAVSAPATQLRPGFLMRAEASALDVEGKPVEGKTVTWRSLTPATLDVSPDGLLLALAPGIGIARASSGTVSAELHLDLVNPPIAELRLDADTLRLAIPGAQRKLEPTVRDEMGIGIIGATLSWESSAARIAAVTTSGLVTPIAVGHTTVTARGDGMTAAVEVFVEAPPTPGSPIITSIAPQVAVPGQQLVVNGSGFGTTPARNTVYIDGVPIPITSASATQLLLAVPAAAAFPCQSARSVALQVGTSNGIGAAPVGLVVATTRALGVGQSLILTSATDARCNEIAPAPGRYLVTLPNAARALGAGPIGLTVRGEATGASTVQLLDTPAIALRNEAAVRAMLAGTERALAGVDATAWLRGRIERRRARAHLELLEANRAIGARARRTAPEFRAPGGAAITAPTLGAIVPVRVPALEQPNLCDAYTPINARIVQVTDHLVLLEDTSSVVDGLPTVARQMDADYLALGSELEARGWPVVTAFGDPLVMDGRLDDNGRVMLVFSRRLNQKSGGAILAAVVNCDFFPRAQFVASNQGEYLYAQVPTSLADGMAAGTRARWRHEMRATIVHELKHVASYAERIVRGQPLEESWLEEATARDAEELYGRAAFGSVRNGNTGFSAQLACELLAGDPAYPTCADAPRAIRPHLEALWTFLDAPAALSPLGPSAAGDFSFYGSGWALTRWLADLEAPSEPLFFTALTTSGQAGVTNLEARTGRSWDEMLPEWSLALAADDRPGLVTASPRLRFTSWDLRGNFLGLCEVSGSCITPQAGPFVRAAPLRPLALEAGPFTVEFASVAPGGFVAIELLVTPATAKQVIELKGYHGAPLPPGVRMGILRVE